jgi:DNA-binding NarL/FixJ family response regulator
MTLEQQDYHALIIDDHPLITEAYKSALLFYQKKNESASFTISVCHDCDSACNKIEVFASNNEALDIVFLDISLPPSEDGKILSGEDLGLKINQELPDTKIIVSTSFNDNYRIHSIFKNINPDGFLIKNDITPKELVQAIDEVLLDPPYYSKTVLKLLRKEVASDYIVDELDRKILYELSIGTMTKDMPNMIPLSLPGIKKRKNHLRKVMGTSSMNDQELIFIAKEKGFI